MFCKYCGRFLSKTWRYCPHCGRRIKDDHDPFEQLFRRSLGGFTVRITSVERPSSRDRSEKASPKASEKKRTIRLGGYDEATIPPHKKIHSFSDHRVLEPEGKTEQRGEHIIIQVNLPGVKEEDIDIQKLDESIEIKAFKEKEAFFKQIQVPKSSKILSHHLEGDELIIKMR